MSWDSFPSLIKKEWECFGAREPPYAYMHDPGVKPNMDSCPGSVKSGKALQNIHCSCKCSHLFFVKGPDHKARREGYSGRGSSGAKGDSAATAPEFN